MDRDRDSIICHGPDGGIDFDATLAALRGRVAFSDAAVVTALPRGGLQVVQPRQTDPARLRRYVRDAHALDAIAWHAMACCRIAHSGQVEELGPQRAEVAAAFERDFLRPGGYAHYCAVPLPGVVLPGYPAVLQLFRTADAGPFDARDLDALAAVATTFEAAIEAEHARRRKKHNDYPLNHKLPREQFVCTRDGGFVFPGDSGEVLDEVLRRNLLEAAQQRLNKMAGGEGVKGRIEPEAAGSNADRLLVPDRLGDFWAFRLTLFPSYPALTGSADEPVAFASHQPECESWSTLRPTDFAADAEIARLVPALHYMQQHYRDNASLHEIAKTVFLSPFHFHRRFTDLLGITPKHYLFDCQISEAKRRLAAGDLSLKDIAAHCGFAHQSHFTSRFKQATGLTPTAWRRLAEDATRATR